MMCLIVILIQNSMEVKMYFIAFFNKVQKKGRDYYKTFFFFFSITLWKTILKDKNFPLVKQLDSEYLHMFLHVPVCPLKRTEK